MDKGENAVLKTMDYWDTVPGIRRLGIHRSQEERDKPVIIEKNGIRLGFLAYTYGTNGLPVPRDKPFMVSLIDEKIMAEEIEALRPLCDYLVVSMHWGEEYTHVPNGAQRKAAEFLAARDVDLILGHHPHVIQPFESIPRPDGGTTLCYYSLGNFISGQTRNPTLLGALASVTIKKTDGMITVEEAGAIPVVTHYENGFTGFRVYPLAAYTAELAGKHWARMMGSEVSIPYFSELAKKIFPERILNKSPAAK
jgi:poly-gamma-glutamate synthesis protein (capsule biosynthesis protein)